MKEMWNQRYQQEEYVYGVEPNEFFKVQIEELIPRRMLLPAEGEGRNAVFAASLGWRVHAFDQSEVAKEKALALAASKAVKIKYEISTFEALRVGHTRYDVIGLIYAHMPSRIRREFHQKLSQLLKKGGIIILEAFSKEQLQNNSGGPKNEDMLYDAVELREDFKDLNLDYLSFPKIELNEGKYHQGKASIIRMIVRKK